MAHFTPKHIISWPVPLLLICLLLFSGCAGKRTTSRTGDQCPASYRSYHLNVDPVILDDLQYVKDDIAKYSGTNPELMIISGNVPNAYAFADKKQKKIAINLGLINLLGENLDEYAFVIAHEMAHIGQGHISKKQSYNSNVSKTGSALGLAMEAVGIGLGIPFSGLISSATINSGAHLMKMGYSRDQEREADELGLKYMRQAGFDPWAAITFQEKLQQSTQENIAILSTHPQSEERIDNLKKIIRANTPKE